MFKKSFQDALTKFDKLKALLIRLIKMLENTVAFLQQIVREIE